jgi:hypothetical protein
VERTVDGFGKLHVGRNRQEHVARLHCHLVFVEVVVLQQLDVVERAFHQRLGAGLAVFFQQVTLEAAGIHADPDRTAVGLRRADHFGDPLARSDVAGVDTEASRALVGSFERPLVVEVNVGNDRHVRRAGDFVEPRRRFRRGAAHPDDIDPGILAAANLVDRRPDILGRSIGHGLHGDRGIPAHRYLAQHDLPALAARNVAPGAYRRHAGRYRSMRMKEQ